MAEKYTHRVIPAEAGIHVRLVPQAPAYGRYADLDPGLRRDDIVVGNVAACGTFVPFERSSHGLAS